MSAERFFIKRASLATILPTVAGPALGGLAGRVIGARLNAENLGATLGVITGGVSGQLLKENLEQQQTPQVPIGAPYAIDPATRDIPPWALSGAQFLQPTLKQGSFWGTVGPDIGGSFWTAGEGIRDKLPKQQIAKNVAGAGAGIIGGGYAGHMLGHLINRGVGHEVKGPFGVPLSTLLAGLGATVGNVKGLEFVNRNR